MWRRNQPRPANYNKYINVSSNGEKERERERARIIITIITRYIIKKKKKTTSSHTKAYQFVASVSQLSVELFNAIDLLHHFEYLMVLGERGC